MLKDAQICFDIFSSAQVCSARSILEAIGTPKVSAKSSFSDTVVAGLLFSRRLEFRDVLKHILFLRFRKCRFST